jgi:hypothetical protein
LPGDRIPVDNQFHWHFSSLADASAFEVPIRLFAVRPILQIGVWCFVEKRSPLRGGVHLTRHRQLQFAAIFAQGCAAVHLEIQQMTAPIADVIVPPFFNLSLIFSVDRPTVFLV